jgi:hypothetical protein
MEAALVVQSQGKISQHSLTPSFLLAPVAAQQASLATIFSLVRLADHASDTSGRTPANREKRPRHTLRLRQTRHASIKSQWLAPRLSNQNCNWDFPTLSPIAESTKLAPARHRNIKYLQHYPVLYEENLHPCRLAVLRPTDCYGPGHERKPGRRLVWRSANKPTVLCNVTASNYYFYSQKNIAALL